MVDKTYNLTKIDIKHSYLIDISNHQNPIDISNHQMIFEYMFKKLQKNLFNY